MIFGFKLLGGKNNYFLMGICSHFRKTKALINKHLAD